MVKKFEDYKRNMDKISSNLTEYIIRGYVAKRNILVTYIMLLINVGISTNTIYKICTNDKILPYDASSFSIYVFVILNAVIIPLCMIGFSFFIIKLVRMYKDGYKTYLRQEDDYIALSRVIDELLENAEKFNKKLGK